MPQNIKDYIAVIIAFSLGSLVAVAGSNGGYEY